MTGEFSTLAHIMAPAMLAMPGPSVPMHRPGLPVMRDTASAMKPALLVMRRDHLPAARSARRTCDEVRVGNAEQRVDALGLEEIQNAFIDFYSHVKLLDFLTDSVERVVCDALRASRTANG